MDAGGNFRLRNPIGKAFGFSGTKIGNAHIKWAFSEAAVCFLEHNPAGQRFSNGSARSTRRARP